MLPVSIETSSTSWAEPKCSGRKWSRLATGRHPSVYIGSRGGANTVQALPNYQAFTYPTNKLYILSLYLSDHHNFHFGQEVEGKIIYCISVDKTREGTHELKQCHNFSTSELIFE